MCHTLFATYTTHLNAYICTTFQGENGRLTYELVQQPEPGTFKVNSTTGEIILAKELDHETRTEHTLTMAVTDSGDPSMSDDALVHVKVTDVNDNDPVITFMWVGLPLYFFYWLVQMETFYRLTQ